MDKVILNAEGIIVFFENAIVVNDISITVREKEIVGLFGPNSSGKSTILNVISGLILDKKKMEERKGGERITIRGNIYFNGKDITWIWPHKRAKMGLVASRERHSIFPESSVEENLKIASYMLKKERPYTRIELVYSIFPHLRLVKNRKAGLLSGGEQQMLSISMALVAKPRLILMDEPLFGLSPALYDEFFSAIRRIKNTGISLLIADQFAAPLLSVIERGYVVENGTLVFHGSKDELLGNTDIYSAYLG